MNNFLQVIWKAVRRAVVSPFYRNRLRTVSVEELPEQPESQKLYLMGDRTPWSAALVCPCGCAVEFAFWVESNVNGRYCHIAECGAFAKYVDPACFLDLFAGPGGYGTAWSDPMFKQMLSDAHMTSDRALRMAKLAECERLLLGAMPILPLCQVVQAKLRKPFVRGLGSNLLNREQFKYAWIDTDWRQQ